MATKESAIVHLLRSRISYARMKIEGPMKQGEDVVIPEAVSAIVKCMQKVKQVSVEDGEALQHLLRESTFPDYAPKTILDAIDAKVDLGGGENTQREPRQTLLFPEEWQSEKCWHIYFHEKSVDTRLMCMARRLRVVGGHHLTEPSYSAAAAVALCANAGIDATEALRNTRKLKTFFRSLDAHDSFRGPDSYPPRHGPRDGRERLSSGLGQDHRRWTDSEFKA